jgi:hypothetical protein
MTGHAGRAIVAEIRLLGTTPRVRVIEAHHGASTLRHLFAALVADEDRLSCHRILLQLRFDEDASVEKAPTAQAYCSTLIYTPIHE